MTAAGFQGITGQNCQGLLTGLKYTASAQLSSAKRVRVVLDANALEILTGTPSALKEFRALAPSAELRFDIDLALCQGRAVAALLMQYTQSKLRKAHNEAARSLGSEHIVWPVKVPSLHMDAEAIYFSAFEYFWLLNKVHQCINEATAMPNLPLANQIGSALRKLVNAHNREHAKYPDEAFLAAAQALAFSFVKPMSQAAKEVDGQASYLKATWPMLLWSRAATRLACDAPDEVRVLLTDEACPIGNADTHKRIKCSSVQAELSHDLLHLFLACMQLQMPISPQSMSHRMLVASGAELQREVDDAVATSRVIREVEQGSCLPFGYPQKSM